MKELLCLLNKLIVATSAVIYCLGCEKSTNELIANLKDENFTIRRDAAEVLGNRRDTLAVGPLIGALNDSYPDVRWSAATALGKIKASLAVEPLISKLFDQDWYVQCCAVEALGRIKDQRSVDPLIIALTDKRDDVRSCAAQVLGNFKDLRAVDPLINALDDQDISVQRSAANALARLGDKRVIPILLPRLQHWTFGPAAAEALERLGWKSEFLKDQIHRLVANKDGASLKKRWKETKRVLLEDIESDNYYEIENALYAFIAIGEKQIIPELIKAINHSGTKIMAEAYLNCGNTELSNAATIWANEHGFNIVKSGSGATPVNWGTW